MTLKVAWGVGGWGVQGGEATELPAITLWTCAVPSPHKPPLAYKSCCVFYFILQFNADYSVEVN